MSLTITKGINKHQHQFLFSFHAIFSREYEFAFASREKVRKIEICEENICTVVDGLWIGMKLS